MRSSKNRSRSKGNRNRSVGNIVNRVFDSSGPEGKVRGTPQQIIEKYNQLARDAQLANDRVAAENFQQHAEHYLRLLAEAQREQEARREQQQAQQNQQNQQGGQQSGQGHSPKSQSDAPKGAGGEQAKTDEPAKPDEATKPEGDSKRDDRPFDAVMEDQGGDSGLVETPESKPKRTRRPRRAPTQEGGEKPARKPRKKAEPDQGAADGSDGDQPPKEAAE
ncbi:Eukaryotic translation initiation factor 3 subunit 10 [Roseibacterium elongatum DSM 19469]|uniref:Eukaryotic translation initiation factor 3 subunit 10 n=1 Tax=Roseicyclus elongatus DSM 19469 TaxID=1294273 RepID=W8RW15_9RHOB|nr:DUF4167 domain-containing protein [Roseibacterium elongatum]AHM05473.1 Eukaryotic translation initiation factor 3 subunit 10 [Roseibacterium elongatum DSM 19469]